jgi:hypothetical protein
VGHEASEHGGGSGEWIVDGGQWVVGSGWLGDLAWIFGGLC